MSALFSARRKFGLYWRMICAGSSLIRRMWLRAIKRRAEQDHDEKPGTIRGARCV
jgi:hypothetical protein